MSREIDLLQSTFQFRAIDGSQGDYYSAQARKLEQLMDSRVTFISLDGRVIGDSEMASSAMDNHLKREEIISATKGDIGSSIRYSESIRENMLYVAKHVISEDGSFDGYIRLSMSLKAVERDLSKGWLMMAGGLLLLFLAAALVSYRISRGLTKPLEHITLVANRISRLDYDARVQLTRRDEIGQLGLAINRMAGSLQEQMKVIRDNEDLLQSVLTNMVGGILMVEADGRVALMNREAEQFLHVEQDKFLGKSYLDLKRNHDFQQFMVEGMDTKEYLKEERNVYDPEQRTLQFERVPMFEDDGKYRGMLFLLQDVTEIRRLETMRSQFVANVSHELKTPIAAVKGFAETLLSGGVEDKETERSFLQIIYDEGDRLNRLIGDILELSKIESKLVPLEYSPVQLKELIDSLYEVLLPVASRKSIMISNNVPEHLFIEADEDRLRQVFMNLLSNAISYTLEGGRVKVEAEIVDSGEEQEDERVRISISDTGIGIPKKDLPRIFERFYRVDKARSRSSGGTGLGLSIVKHLVDLHHGMIAVESRVGEGTTFFIELPITQNLA
ncbi:PAS domain-containing sensor histidine kinase [Paenibacillus aceti]|uniref:histidine kinase n=2 Tax=Paenibacillus aceti TaxID=1820010 RepID=A0ABQ1VST6_9BACL|nr:PAS domain-containing sensor histidine kinase [Paenibacillus aceti]